MVPRQHGGAVWRAGLATAGRRCVCLAVAGLLPLLPAMPAAAMPVVDAAEAPQVGALLAHAWASEVGRGARKNIPLALALYGQAGKLGSAEGYFHAGRLQLTLARERSSVLLAACLLVAASQLGHQAAGAEIDRLGDRLTPDALACDENRLAAANPAPVDLDRHLAGLSPSRQKIGRLVRELAPHYGVDPQLALAVATVESNLDPAAVSPRQAMGVMQLIPATAERFNVQRPFDPEQNIRGGLAYLRWLQQYFAGDTVRVLAAYNAGERAVDRHGGIPPYAETGAYVARVLGFSARGLTVPAATLLSPPRAGGGPHTGWLPK